MEFLNRLLYDLSQADTELALLVTLIIFTIILIDALTFAASKKREQSGVAVSAETLGIDGCEILPTKNYVSDIQGLAGKPDALIRENGYVIPVERKPLARKLRDRYVAQLLVYMRLIEEFEGKKPPYGYLILGEKCRRVKVQNTEERQHWLQSMLDEMRAALEQGCSVVPQPEKRKCEFCQVHLLCNHSLATSKHELDIP